MDSSSNAAAVNGTLAGSTLSGRRRGSPAQIAARDKFAAEWGGQNGLIAKEATPERTA
jgi:hypothetical protein